MSTDAPIRSRRAVLGAALGGAAAVAAQSLASPLSAAAASGDPALIGAANTGDAPTSFENTDAGETSLAAVHSGSGTGLQATSVTGPAIMAISTDATPSDPETGPDPSHRNGIYAAVGDTSSASTVTDEAGVYGFADVSAGLGRRGRRVVPGRRPDRPRRHRRRRRSARPRACSASAPGAPTATGDVGIVGDVNATGVGVYGFAGTSAIPNPPTGIGVYARAGSNSQLALRVQGRAKFSRSGRVSVSGATKTVTLSGVSAANSFIVATCQEDAAGVYVRSVVPANGSFKIHLSKKPSKAVTVGWIVFEKP